MTHILKRQSVLASEIVVVERDSRALSVKTGIAKIIIEHFAKSITHPEADARIIQPPLRLERH